MAWRGVLAKINNITSKVVKNTTDAVNNGVTSKVVKNTTDAVKNSVILTTKVVKNTTDAVNNSVILTTKSTKGFINSVVSVTKFTKWAILLLSGGACMFGASKLIDSVTTKKFD